MIDIRKKLLINLKVIKEDQEHDANVKFEEFLKKEKEDEKSKLGAHLRDIKKAI